MGKQMGTGTNPTLLRGRLSIAASRSQITAGQDHDFRLGISINSVAGPDRRPLADDQSKSAGNFFLNAYWYCGCGNPAIKSKATGTHSCLLCGTHSQHTDSGSALL